jgi:ketosteroid isomerase-like protein
MSKKKHDPDEAEIRALDAEWSKAVSAKNANKIDQIVKFYAADGSVVWPDYPPAKGHAKIRAAWKKIYFDVPDMYVDFEPTHIEISSGRDMASDFGLVHFAAGAKPDDVKNTAKYFMVWKRERGTWKVFYDCWNWNAPEKDRQ